MRNFAFLVPLVLTAALAAPSQAQPESVNVTLGSEMGDTVRELGAREVREQAARLVDVVRDELDRRGALHGARVDLVLTDLKPNHPTFEQTSRRPGLDMIRSRSIGGATIEGQITTADGQVQPVRYEWYTTSLDDVRGYTTWRDAEVAYSRLADNLAEGRFTTR
jgi:hypothetical protein